MTNVVVEPPAGNAVTDFRIQPEESSLPNVALSLRDRTAVAQSSKHVAKASIRLKPSMNFTREFSIRRLDFNRHSFCNSAILSRSDRATFAEQKSVTALPSGAQQMSSDFFP